ncbi:MAG: sigma-70 family RNA polymerase sigma factor [Ignavibacteria bacterium]|nr:MAG: sigma-70 family RNA polymerase sigma factor [Ignavibacteria bacterium]
MTEFRKIVNEHEERVRNTLFRFVKTREDTEDIAQEVFIQVYESMGKFRGDAELSTWIYKITVNKAIDFLRRKKRKKRFAQLTSIFGNDEEYEEVNIPSSSNPASDLETEQRKEILNMALDKLPENQRTAIILSRYEGFSNKEIAKIMSSSVSSVESLLHRAKKNLHKILYDYYEKKIF